MSIFGLLIEQLSIFGRSTDCLNGSHQEPVDLSVFKTASVACSGMRDGSDKILVVVLSCRSAFKTAVKRTDIN